jgi:flagellar protein FliS
VTAASPHELITMLFEGAMVAVASAKQQMAAGDIPAKGKSISRAIAIIENGLRASLDRNVGGDIAQNLDALYQYMCTSLLNANVQNQPAVLDEIHQLLKGLKEAWDSIKPASAQSAPAAEPPAAKKSPYDPLALTQPTHLVKA